MIEYEQIYKKKVIFHMLHLPDGEAVLGIISRRFGADELPLITAVLNKLLVLVAIFLLNPPSPNILK